MKRLLLTLLFLPFLVFAQQGPPAWQVPADDSVNGSDYLVVTGSTAQAIIDNLDLVVTNLFTRTEFPNMDTDSTDDITNIVVGTPTVQGGAVTVAAPTATVKFPTAVTNVNYSTAAGAGAASIAGPDLSITFPEVTSTALDNTLMLVAMAHISDNTGVITPINADTEQGVWYEIAWNAAAEDLKYEHPDFIGSLTNGLFTVPAGQAGKYFVTAGATFYALNFNDELKFVIHYYTGTFAGSAKTDLGYFSANDSSDARGCYFAAPIDAAVGGKVGTAFIFANSGGTPDNAEPETLSIGIYKVQD